MENLTSNCCAFSIFHLVPEENIATMKYGAQVVKGELKSALLDGDTQNYDLDHGFSRHPIDDDHKVRPSQSKYVSFSPSHANDLPAISVPQEDPYVIDNGRLT